MLSQQDLTRLEITCGKKTPELPARSLNLGKRPSAAIKKPTGKEYGSLRKKESSKRYLRKYEFVIIGVSDQLRPTLVSQLEWSEAALSSGVELAQESLAELGKSPVWTLILKVCDY